MQLDQPVSNEIVAQLSRLPVVSFVIAVAQGLRIESADFKSSLGPILSALNSAGIRVEALQADGAALQNVFIQLTGHALRDEKTPASP